MMTDTVIADLAIDKSKWKPVQLGDVVEESREVVRDPVKEGIERVVGLEHIDPESIHLDRWDTLEQSTTFTKRFNKGQVLFGRRRAYLKKAALATFDGICSGDITVLQARRNLIPDLLPFLINNNKFFDYAVKNSAGSLSPRAKFKDLANYEFLLPPEDQQARLAELLWAADASQKALQLVFKNLLDIKDRISAYYFTDGAGAKITREVGGYKIPDHWSVRPISDVANVDYGISESVANNKDSSIGWPILTGANITLNGQIQLDKIVYIETPTNEKFHLHSGDLLFNWRSGSPEHVGKTAMFDLEGNYTYASFILRIRCSPNLNNRFAFYLLNHLRKIEYFTKDIAQQVNFKMNAAVFREVAIPLPPLEEQNAISKRLDLLSMRLQEVDRHWNMTKRLQQSLIKQIF